GVTSGATPTESQSVSTITSSGVLGSIAVRVAGVVSDISSGAIASIAQRVVGATSEATQTAISSSAKLNSIAVRVAGVVSDVPSGAIASIGLRLAGAEATPTTTTTGHLGMTGDMGTMTTCTTIITNGVSSGRDFGSIGLRLAGAIPDFSSERVLGSVSPTVSGSPAEVPSRELRRIGATVDAGPADTTT
ncbi:hypothetical protein OXX69_012586, partial [Metschnikowia pulcherrima]